MPGLTIERMMPDPLRYMVSDYAATGEGRTVSILIEALRPKDEEWARAPGFEAGRDYVEGELGVEEEAVLRRQFEERFDDWWARGMEVMSRREMMRDYGAHLPPAVADAIEKGGFGGFSFFAQIHVNYS